MKFKKNQFQPLQELEMPDFRQQMGPNPYPQMGQMYQQQGQQPFTQMGGQQSYQQPGPRADPAAAGRRPGPSNAFRTAAFTEHPRHAAA